jgi:hypothetical protein
VTVATSAASMGVAAPRERGERPALWQPPAARAARWAWRRWESVFGAAETARPLGRPAIDARVEAGLLVAAAVRAVAAVAAFLLVRGRRAPP